MNIVGCGGVQAEVNLQVHCKAELISASLVLIFSEVFKSFPCENSGTPEQCCYSISEEMLPASTEALQAGRETLDPSFSLTQP